MKYLNSIDLSKNELQNARIHNLASAPATPVTGQVYYDSVTNASYIWNGTSWRPVDAAKLTDGTIANTALATNPLARANHTGTQLASTISDFNTAVQLNRLDQLTAPTDSVSLNSQQITNLAAPTLATDAANKQYVDNKVAGISWKDEVKVATTASGTLASSFANGSTVDGIVLATNDRILIKNQSSDLENGIYTVNVSGSPTRALDADSQDDLYGAAVFVTHGTTNAGKRFVCNNSGTITLGSTAITFVQFDGGTIYTAGNGLTLSSTDFNVGAGTGILVSADTVSIDTSVVARKFSASIGNGALTSIPVIHSLNTQDCVVSVRDNSTHAVVMTDVVMTDVVMTDVVMTDVNTVTLTFSVAPTSNQYRVTVIG